MKKIPVSLPVKLSADEAEQLAARHQPRFYTGFKKYNPAIVHGYRQQLQQSKSQPGLNATQNAHCESFVAVCEKFKKHIQTQNINYVIKEFFVAEIDKQIRDNKLSSYWVDILMVRYTAAIDELGFNASYPKMDIIMADKLWTSHSATKNYLESADDETPNLNAKITEIVDEFYNDETYYYCLGSTHLGVAFLTSSFIQRVYPVAIFPAAKVSRLHGRHMGSFANHTHDIAHGLNGINVDKVIEYISIKSTNFSDITEEQYCFASWFTPYAMARFRAIFTCMQHIYVAFISRLLPSCNQSEFKLAMVGFFILAHEPGSILNSYMLDCNDIISILRNLVRRTKNDPFVFRDVDRFRDLLRSSLLDGRIDYTTIPKTYEHINVNDIHFTSDSIERFPVNMQNGIDLNCQARINSLISNSKVSYKVPLVITHTLSNGQQFDIEYDTGYVDWLELDDHIALLNLSGIPFKKPNMNGLNYEQSIECAEQTGKIVDAHMRDLLDHFEKHALYFLQEPDHTGKSLKDMYFQWHFRHTSFVDAQIEKAKSKLKHNSW